MSSSAALALLQHLKEVEKWVLEKDERARPYLDAGAIKVEDGRVHFHKQRFIEVMVSQLCV